MYFEKLLIFSFPHLFFLFFLLLSLSYLLSLSSLPSLKEDSVSSYRVIFFPRLTFKKLRRGLAKYPRMALNLQSSCLDLRSCGIPGVPPRPAFLFAFLKHKLSRLRYSMIGAENKLSPHVFSAFLTTLPTQHLGLPLLPCAVYILEPHMFEDWMNYKNQSI